MRIANLLPLSIWATADIRLPRLQLVEMKNMKNHETVLAWLAKEILSLSPSGALVAGLFKRPRRDHVDSPPYLL